MVLDFILRKLDHIDGGITWIGNEKVKDLDYTDDICLLDEGMLASDASKIEIKIICSETENMKMSQPHTTQINVDGAGLKEVEKFAYLGRSIMSDRDIIN